MWGGSSKLRKKKILKNWTLSWNSPTYNLKNIYGKQIMSMKNTGSEHASRIWPRTSPLPRSTEEAFLRAAAFHLHFLWKSESLAEHCRWETPLTESRELRTAITVMFWLGQCYWKWEQLPLFVCIPLKAHSTLCGTLDLKAPSVRNELCSSVYRTILLISHLRFK